MSTMPVAFKMVAGACVLVLSFWMTLKFLEYRESILATPQSTQPIAPGDGVSRGLAPARRTIRLFDENSSRVDDLAVTWNAAEGFDGSRTAVLLDDSSKIYASISQEVPVPDDDREHTISIDIR